MNPQDRRAQIMPYATQPPDERLRNGLDHWDNMTAAEREAAHLVALDRLHDEAANEVGRLAAPPPPPSRGKAANGKAPFNWRKDLISARDLIRKNFPEIVWVVPGILAEGLTL